MKRKEPKFIALDCDDVLLNYNHAWGDMYAKYFNLPKFNEPVNPKAYYAAEYWGIEWDDFKPELQEFNKHFHIYGWRDMQALDGAIEATHILRDNGYKIFVVTRMPASGEKQRSDNLHELGFAFDAVIGTGHTTTHNPKKPFIEALNPEYFVDDLITNFVGIESDTKFVWLDVGRIHEENEQLKDVHDIHHTHSNLFDFVTTVIQK